MEETSIHVIKCDFYSWGKCILRGNSPCCFTCSSCRACATQQNKGCNRLQEAAQDNMMRMMMEADRIKVVSTYPKSTENRMDCPHDAARYFTTCDPVAPPPKYRVTI